MINLGPLRDSLVTNLGPVSDNLMPTKEDFGGM